MARRKIKSATDQRNFTIVYNDFLESNLLDKHEKLIYIAIKRFADNNTLKAFPSLKTLNKITGISIRWIKKSIEHMEQLGVISVEHRVDDEKGHQSNLYTLYDYAEIWQAGSSIEIENVKKKNFVDLSEVSTEVLLEELQRRNKEKEPDITEPTKDQSYQALEFNQYDIVNTTINSKISQELERYTIGQIKQIFDYDILVEREPLYHEDIDTVMNILYDALNCNKPTIRISGENKPTDVVTDRLMKLNYETIMYVIRKYSEQTDRITNHDAYLLTMLYKANDQMHLDITNQVQHDMYGEPPTE